MADWNLPRDPLLALREGDPGPFEAFVRSHARAFFAFFRRQGAGPHRAEDLTQDVLLKLYHHAPRYRAEERFGALCLRVARNAWIDHRRRQGARGAGRSQELDEEAMPPARTAESPRGPAEAAAVAEESARIAAALAEIPETHRAVFELGVVEERGYAEIAEILGIPVGTVKSRMHHAVRKLRHVLGEEEGAA